MKNCIQAKGVKIALPHMDGVKKLPYCDTNKPQGSFASDYQ